MLAERVDSSSIRLRRSGSVQSADCMPGMTNVVKGIGFYVGRENRVESCVHPGRRARTIPVHAQCSSQSPGSSRSRNAHPGCVEAAPSSDRRAAADPARNRAAARGWSSRQARQTRNCGPNSRCRAGKELPIEHRQVAIQGKGRLVAAFGQIEVLIVQLGAVFPDKCPYPSRTRRRSARMFLRGLRLESVEKIIESPVAALCQ